ncbi:hypothetical protein BH09VER1_BH09VER1_48770 [soil metagenome]
MENNKEKTDKLTDALVTWGLIVLAGLVAILGVMRMVSPKATSEVDKDTLLFFVTAAVILLLRKVKEFSFGGNTVTFQEIETKIHDVQAGLESVVSSQADGAKAKTLARKAETLVATDKAGKEVSETEAELEALKRVKVMPGGVKDDPWNGAFGMSATANDWELRAAVRRLTRNSEYFEVKLEVVSLAKEKPKAKYVRFFLHDSFDPDKPIVTVKDGVATYEVTSYGSFTVGALTDRGTTRLELNLAKLPNMEKDFRNR